MLQSGEKRQLQDALTSAIPALNKLKQFASYELGENLEKIANCSDLSAATYDLIEWAGSTGNLEKVINAAWKNNPTNPDLKEFVEQVWKPLLPSQEPTVSLQQRTEAEAPPPTENPVEPQSLPVDINTKRYLRPTNKGDTEQIIQGAVEPLCASPLPFPLNTTTELRNHINTAGKYIQNVCNIFLPEKEVFSDQCQFAVKQVQAADERIDKDLTESIHVLYIHAPARSLLELERTHFCDEARKTMIFLQEFASQTSSHSLHKKVWAKLQLLMRSLQELDDLIDALQKSIEENKADN